MTSAALPTTRSGDPIRYGAGPQVWVPTPQYERDVAVLAGLVAAYTIAGVITAAQGVPNRPQDPVYGLEPGAYLVGGEMAATRGVSPRPQPQVYGQLPAAYTVDGQLTTV